MFDDTCDQLDKLAEQIFLRRLAMSPSLKGNELRAIVKDAYKKSAIFLLARKEVLNSGLLDTEIDTLTQISNYGENV